MGNMQDMYSQNQPNSPRPPRPYPAPPRPHPEPPPAFDDGRNLPIYPTYSHQVINGVKYKTYLETSWTQVKTEDGVNLRDLLRSLPILGKDSFYRYKGVLRNLPEISAIDQLYNLPHPDKGDVYLVEARYLADGRYVCEVYAYLGRLEGWVYHGTTNRRATAHEDLPNVLKLMPSELGDADQFLIVSADGKRITWGNPIRDHDKDPKAHEDIRKLIEDIRVEAGKVIVFNDTIRAEGWLYNPNNNYFEYVFQSDRIPAQSYFEITPIINDQTMSRVIAIARINPTYLIKNQPGYPSYAILRAVRVPTMNIGVSVKVIGPYVEKSLN